MSEDQQTYQRAVGAALLGLGVQLLAAFVLLVLAMWADNPLLRTATWHAFGGVGLWVCLWIVYKQHQLERIEALEAEQIAQRHGADSSIFETTADDLNVARRRLKWLHKYLLPLTSLLTAGYLIGVGSWLTQSYLAVDPAELLSKTASPLMLMFATAAVAFICFVVSRYFAGMAKVDAWSMLRGGAGYVIGVALLCVVSLLVIGLYETEWLAGSIMRNVTIGAAVFMIVIGIEIALNFILDIYRPRRPGELPRPAFDSRLLSLLTAPESIASTINEAINYQFGFEITRSWFWQLFSKVFVWLIVLAAGVLIVLSSIVIVEPHQRGLVTNFGRLTGELEPGPHLKLPWPIGRVQTFDVRTVRQMSVIGDTELVPGVPILWSNVHTEDTPENLIVAAPPRPVERRDQSQDNAPDTDERVSISLVNAEVYLQYRIAPGKLVEYVMANADANDSDAPDRRLQQIAQVQLSRYLLRHTIDQWIGTARATAGDALAGQIQTAADRAKLGVQIVDVVVASIHPPQEAAEAFHEVVGAEQERQTAIERARAQAIQTLANVAGSIELATQIVNQIENYREKEKDGSNAMKLAKLAREIERLLLSAGGQASRIIAEARAYRWEKENREAGKAVRFAKQLMAYAEAPRLYRARQKLAVQTDALKEPRKYLIVSDREDLILRGDLKDSPSQLRSLETQIEEAEKGKS